MKIKILYGWNHWRDGQVVDPPEGVAELLIRRGLAVPTEKVAPVNAAAPMPGPEQCLRGRKRAKV